MPVIIEEAGGRVTDFAGARAIDSGTFLATNGHLHETIRQRLLDDPTGASAAPASAAPEG